MDLHPGPSCLTKLFGLTPGQGDKCSLTPKCPPAVTYPLMGYSIACTSTTASLLWEFTLDWTFLFLPYSSLSPIPGSPIFNLWQIDGTSYSLSLLGKREDTLRQHGLPFLHCRQARTGTGTYLSSSVELELIFPGEGEPCF